MQEGFGASQILQGATLHYLSVKEHEEIMLCVWVAALRQPLTLHDERCVRIVGFGLVISDADFFYTVQVNERKEQAAQPHLCFVRCPFTKDRYLGTYSVKFFRSNRCRIFDVG